MVKAEVAQCRPHEVVNYNVRVCVAWHTRKALIDKPYEEEQHLTARNLRGLAQANSHVNNGASVYVGLVHNGRAAADNRPYLLHIQSRVVVRL